jgi:hypothetical protein
LDRSAKRSVQSIEHGLSNPAQPIRQPETRAS